jgi:hypothetical protein
LENKRTEPFEVREVDSLGETIPVCRVPSRHVEVENILRIETIGAQGVHQRPIILSA